MITKLEIIEIIRDNIKWSPYGSTNYTMLDSFEIIAEEIVKRIEEIYMLRKGTEEIKDENLYKM